MTRDDFRASFDAALRTFGVLALLLAAVLTVYALKPLGVWLYAAANGAH